jgi:hypothetical protein
LDGLDHRRAQGFEGSPSECDVAWAILDKHFQNLHGLEDVLLGLCGERSRTKLRDEKLVKSEARWCRNVHQGCCIRQDHGPFGRFEKKSEMGKRLCGGVPAWDKDWSLGLAVFGAEEIYAQGLSAYLE